MHLAVGACRTLSLSQNVFFLDILKRQDELDGQRNMGVLSLECQSLDLIGSLIKKAAKPTTVFSRSWGKVSLVLNFLPVAYLGLFFQKSLHLEKIDQTIKRSTKWLDVAKLVGTVALFYLHSFQAATAIFVGLTLAYLQKNNKLPPAIYRAIEFFTTPLLVMDFLSSPITGLLSLLSKFFLFMALAEKLNIYLLRQGNGIDLAASLCAKPNCVNAHQVELYAKKLSSAPFLPLQLEFLPLQLELEYDSTSVHRIPQYLDITIQDDLHEASKEQIMGALTKKIEEYSLEGTLQEGFLRLKKSYLLGGGSDVLPVHWDKYEKMFGLFLRHLLTLDKAELEPILKELNSIGNNCVDAWVGELGAIYPDTQYSGLINKIHAHFAEIRTEQLNEKIRFMLQVSKTKLFGLLNKCIDLTGGENNVHFIQHMHLVLRPVWRTKLAEFAVNSTSNHQNLGSILSGKYYNHFAAKTKESMPHIEDVKTWIEALQEAMKPEVVVSSEMQGARKVAKAFQKIPSQDLMEWVAKNQEKYPLVDENFSFNSAFFTMTQNDSGQEYLQLTTKGAALVLLDAGVLRVKTS
ncbi:MAG: hypothetical protein ACOYL1_01880 [Chlamydiia bacterium]